MHLAARSALLASCLAIRVHALPVTYSVVDVDGGSSAATDSPSDQEATVYHTVTKSSEAKEPEPTTVSITIVSTETTSVKEANVSTAYVPGSASSAPSQKAPVNVSSTTNAPAATTSSSLDALSVLESAQSTFSTGKAPISAQPTTTQAPASKEPTFKAPPPAAEHPKDDGESDEDCDVARVTVTADVPEDEEPTAVPSEPFTKGHGETVTLLSTTTVTPTAAGPTSYYDDGMWHTRYPIKPSAQPEAGEQAPAPVAASNTTSQATNGTYHARRQFNADAPTPAQGQAAGTGSPEMLIHPFLPAGSGAPVARRQLNDDGVLPGPNPAEGTGSPQMLVHPFMPQGTGLARRAVPTGMAASLQGTGIAARALPTGEAASVLQATGIAPRAVPTGEAASFFQATGVAPRAVPTGEAASALQGTGIAARAIPSGEAVPLFQASGIAARAVPSGEAASPEVLLAASVPTAAGIVQRAVPTGYSVVSWNETSEA